MLILILIYFNDKKGLFHEIKKFLTCASDDTFRNEDNLLILYAFLSSNWMRTSPDLGFFTKKVNMTIFQKNLLFLSNFETNMNRKKIASRTCSFNYCCFGPI